MKEYEKTHLLAQEAFNNGCVELPELLKALQSVYGAEQASNWLIAFTSGKVELNQYEDKDE